jgi:hypothetical protein
MSQWTELRLWYNGQRTPEELFFWKKEQLVPVLDDLSIERFLILDEPQFIVLRIELPDAIVSQLQSTLQTLLVPLFINLTREVWIPEDDARNRIISVRSRVIQGALSSGNEGFAIIGKGQDGKWLDAPAELDQQMKTFATFMTDVAGSFTKHYLRSMSSRVSDRWMLSVFIHLLLDSVSTWQSEEKEARDFPYL